MLFPLSTVAQFLELVLQGCELPTLKVGNTELMFRLLGEKSSSMEAKTLCILRKEKFKTKVRWEFSFLCQRAVMFRNILGLFTNLTLFNT